MASEQLVYRPCVGIMVLNRAGQVWIGRRHDAPGEPEGPGAWWQMPQGGIDESEDPARRRCASSARRPAFARCASSPRARAGTATTCRPHCGPRPGAAAIAARSRSGSPCASRAATTRWQLERPGHKPEFDAWRWAELDELIGLIVPFKRAVYEQVLAEFAAPGAAVAA